MAKRKGIVEKIKLPVGPVRPPPGSLLLDKKRKPK